MIYRIRISTRTITANCRRCHHPGTLRNNDTFHFVTPFWKRPIIPSRARMRTLGRPATACHNCPPYKFTNAINIRRMASQIDITVIRSVRNVRTACAGGCFNIFQKLQCLSTTVYRRPNLCISSSFSFKATTRTCITACYLDSSTTRPYNCRLIWQIRNTISI